MAAEGYRFHTVIREISNPYQNRLYEWYQTKLGQSFIPSRSFTQVLKSILPALRRGDVVLLITDENRRHGGVFVDFFGHKASTAPGAAVLSLRTGAPIVPMFMIRHKDQSHTLIIEPELPAPESRDKQEAIVDITQQFTARIENHIRAHPSQWYWTMKRWQTRPE
jgi:KDO2-lipid IV(A) lauroyltransferase